ncbi:hypothetical protein HPP92_022290 [Vanilla planifolia]|uniref:Uncharacterized protein n=1 Tax=Vanilla planifolia TaxID=51239 RepID=A0A835UDD8_VANPL|nr:hypothetical protein HPP92_022290 [Vanilla planifolia]
MSKMPNWSPNPVYCLPLIALFTPFGFRKGFNMVLDEGTNPSQWQLRLQDNWKKVQILSKKGMGYGASIISADRCVSCTTFNILAPIYKRLDEEAITGKVLHHLPSGGMVGNDELVGMYEKSLGDAGYIILKLARTNDQGDGLLTAINRECFRILNYQKMLFNDFADRVAQLLHVESVVPLWQSGTCNVQQVLIVNTHLLFPHNYTLSIVRFVR